MVVLGRRTNAPRCQLPGRTTGAVHYQLDIYLLSPTVIPRCMPKPTIDRP